MIYRTVIWPLGREASNKERTAWFEAICSSPELYEFAKKVLKNRLLSSEVLKLEDEKALEALIQKNPEIYAEISSEISEKSSEETLKQLMLELERSVLERLKSNSSIYPCE